MKLFLKNKYALLFNGDNVKRSVSSYWSRNLVRMRETKTIDMKTGIDGGAFLDFMPESFSLTMYLSGLEITLTTAFEYQPLPASQPDIH